MIVSHKTRVPPEVADLRARLRHSAAHIMADAVLTLFPEAKLTIGPPTEDGFYYDFDVPHPFTQDDLARIEQVMRQRVEADLPFVRHEVSREEARRRFASNPYKLEIIESIPEGEPITLYSHGSFVDLCRGSHVERTGQVRYFKLLTVAGAYWRGDERNPMLQRIYGTAFESQEALEDFLRRREEALKRDHRKLGKELDLFSIHDEVGPGLILWHPKGAVVRSLIEDLWRRVHLQAGYHLAYTPHLGRARLWETSGHLAFYKENMYPPMEMEGEQYYAKPMNCPFHIMIYRSALRSYRDLPLRIGELGTVYRYERGGVLHGLMRVRGFTQDDAHIFCRPDQVEQEVMGVLDLTFSLLEIFGFREVEVVLSTRPAKAVGDVQMWEVATQSLRHALEKRGLEYDVDEGGGAFYGPKIDIKIRDALERAWQCTTVQFDFNLPERFDLTYQGPDGQRHRPYMVHRAILGSLERFLGVLIEHYGGAFPVWLAPVQAVIIPIADRHVHYAQQVAQALREKGIRVHLDDRGERMQAKIRDAQLHKVPYMLIVGDREASTGAVAVRLRSGEDLGPVPLAILTERIHREVTEHR
ncbi:MAG: threonine--tRNA ligase [Dehalococcoidia bacterium]|nr:threonine--tRNA ligase [Dehalococcoidia bacterium]MDW8119211.1 threonine--tRNA ligase [Chloroflexota bacterium]